MELKRKQERAEADRKYNLLVAQFAQMNKESREYFARLDRNITEREKLRKKKRMNEN